MSSGVIRDFAGPYFVSVSNISSYMYCKYFPYIKLYIELLRRKTLWHLESQQSKNYLLIL